MNSAIYTVSVFLGSRAGHDPAYVNATRELGEKLAQNGYQTVFGGCYTGLMKELADGVASKGGLLTSVFPSIFTGSDPRCPNATHTHITTDVVEQRRYMRNVSQVAVVMPGGVNSVSELFDLASDNDTNAICTRHAPLKPVVICNYNGYYDGLKIWLERSLMDGFNTASKLDMFHFVSTPSEVISKLAVLSKNPQTAGSLRP